MTARSHEPPNGQLLSRALRVIAVLGIPEALRDGHQTVEALAERVDVSPEALRRLLRALTTFGVVAEPTPGRFALGEESRSDCPEAASLMAASEVRQAREQLLAMVQNGQVGFSATSGTEIFPYLETEPGPRERAAVVAAPCDLLTGDPRSGGDVHSLRHALPGKDDATCVALLSRCRRAMRPGARLVVVEFVAPPRGDSDPDARGSALIDPHRRAPSAAGRQRTVAEVVGLLDSADLVVDLIAPQPGGAALIRCSPWEG